MEKNKHLSIGEVARLAGDEGPGYALHVGMYFKEMDGDIKVSNL